MLTNELGDFVRRMEPYNHGSHVANVPFSDGICSIVRLAIISGYTTSLDFSCKFHALKRDHEPTSIPRQRGSCHDMGQVSVSKMISPSTSLNDILVSNSV